MTDFEAMLQAQNPKGTSPNLVILILCFFRHCSLVIRHFQNPPIHTSTNPTISLFHTTLSPGIFLRTLSHPIPHQIRFSRRAKYVSLRMSLRRGLEVVVPRAYDLRKIPELLESKRLWIERIQVRFDKLPKPRPIESRPTAIALAALAENWAVEYVATKRRAVMVQETENRLIVSGRIESELACRRALRRWLLRKAQQTLLPWLQRVSQETGFVFGKAAVRLQRSRWGSCSRRKTISLNGKLLFLAPELVRYLFIHELCHTVQMNHSLRFWALVKSHEPDYKRLDKEMSHAMRTIPGWV